MPFPFPDLASEVTLLRTWCDDDVDALVRACNDPILRARVPVPVPYAAAHARDYVELCAAGWATGEQYTFAVVERGAATPSGSVRVGPSPGGATAGYWTAPWARCRGVASGALRLVTQWAIDAELAPIRCYVAPDNVASQRVALAAGYRRDDRGFIVDPEGEEGDVVFVAP